MEGARSDHVDEAVREIWDERPKGPGVIILNETVTRFLFPGQDPLGKTVSSTEWIARSSASSQTCTTATPKISQAGRCTSSWPRNSPAGMQLIVRTTLPPAALAASVLQPLRELNPKQPAAEFQPISGIVDHAVSPRCFFMMLVTAFGARFIAAMLFKTSPWDAATYVLTALGLLAVALVSGYLPARRASRIDPMTALRSQ